MNVSSYALCTKVISKYVCFCPANRNARIMVLNLLCLLVLVCPPIVWKPHSDRNLQGKKKWKSTVLLLSLHQKFMCWLSFSVTHNYLRIMWCIVWSFNLMISCSWDLCIIPMALLSNVRYRWKFVDQFLFYNSWCCWNRHSYD